jgi:hypothetical protein
MFSDPRGLVLLTGRRLGWDLKYLVAKLLPGAGLTVFTVTRHVPAALLLAFSLLSSAFSLRFNHPAFSVSTRRGLCCAGAASSGADLRLSISGSGAGGDRWTVLTSGTVKKPICCSFP